MLVCADRNDCNSVAVRYYTAARTYSKALLTLSAVVNRAFYSPESLNAQFRDEVFKHLRFAGIPIQIHSVYIQNKYDEYIN